MTSMFEGIKDETLNRLRDVLSYPLDIPDTRRSVLCKWIYDHCINSGNDTVSSLLLHHFGSVSTSKERLPYERLNACCKRTFSIEANGKRGFFRQEDLLPKGSSSSLWILEQGMRSS